MSSEARLLNLDRLVGPGDSLAENFEILIAETAKADLHDYRCFRLRAPDGGIDIYARPRSEEGAGIAFQCKAYRQFRADLVTAVSTSAHSARRSGADYPWEVYYLVLPFVPTAGQRIKLEKALGECGGIARIADADEIEATLFRHPSVAQRFFPSVTILVEPDPPRLRLVLQEREPPLELILLLEHRGQTAPVVASAGIRCGTLLNALVGRLALPRTACVAAAGIVDFALEWSLAEVTPCARTLVAGNTLRDEGVPSGAVIQLRYEMRQTGSLGFYRGRAGLPRYVCLQSYFGQECYDIPQDAETNEQSARFCVDAYVSSVRQAWAR